MRVQIDNAEYLFGKDLVEKYPCLENYDYKCRKIEKKDSYGQKYIVYDRSIKISSLKELLKLKKDVANAIIIENSKDKKYYFSILIYDDYLE